MIDQPKEVKPPMEAAMPEEAKPMTAEEAEECAKTLCDIVHPTHDGIMRLLATFRIRDLEIAALREQELERKRHYYVAKYIGETLSDACGYCGKHLRNPIHRRADTARKGPEE